MANYSLKFFFKASDLATIHPLQTTDDGQTTNVP